MKKLLALFFIISFLCFGIDTPDNKDMVKTTQMKEEIEVLKIQVIELRTELEEVMKKNNKDQVYSDSLKYYERAKEDAKEIYSKSAEDAKEIFNSSITLIMSLIAGVGAVLLALLGFIRFENKKQLEKERKILVKLKEDTVNKIEELEIEYKENVMELNEKIKDVEFNSKLGIALNKNTPEEKIEELKKIENIAESLSKENKITLYFELAYNNKSLKEQMIYYHKGIELNPNDPYNYNKIGLLKEKLEDTDGALEYYTQAIKIDPGYIYSYNNRGLLRENLGDTDGALEDYTEAIDLDPIESYSYNCRGLLKEKLGDTDGALEDYTQAIDLDLIESYSYNNRGLLKEKLGDTDGAFEDFTQAIKIEPNEAYGYSNRGLLRGKLGDTDGAFKDFTQAIKIEPKDPYNHSDIGCLKIILKSYESAIEDFNEAIKLNPYIAFIHANKGYALAMLDKYEDALVHLEKSIEIDKNVKFEITISAERYNKFMEFLKNKNDLNNFGKEIYRRLKEKEGIEVI